MTAGGMYGATALGIVGSLVALRVLEPDGAGRFSLAVGTAAFFQLLLELTSDEALIKFGFRYSEQAEWGKFHRLVGLMFRFELFASLAAGVLVAIAGVFSPTLFNAHLLEPMLLAALLPPLQSIESMAAAALVLRRRYDIRGMFLTYSMALRLVGIVVGSHYGVTAAVVGVVAAQAVTTISIAGVGLVALRRFPHAAPAPLGADRRPLLSFVLNSTAGTTLASLRAWAAPLVLGIVRNPTEVGLFRGAQAPLQGIAAFTAPLRLILLTEQTRDWERGNTQKIYAELRRYMIGATLLSALAIVPLELVMPWLVRLLLGEAYAPATPAIRLILVAALIQLILGWTKSFPVSIGRPGLRVVAHGVETATLLPLLIVFGDLWGVTGAAAAVLVSTCAFALTWAVLLHRLTAGRLRPVEPAPA
ncbi:MAG: lipopolysaccharide biosynthesis protein [Gaiellaceae bacterium]